MARIRSFNLDRWSEPDEQRRVRHIGMADARETFEKLKKHLEATGLLPDEYFLFDGEYETQLKGELPNFDHALCVPNYGASEGIYLDISLVCRNEDGSRKFIPFATGKTLEESGDAFLRMHRIAGECSLLLNGRGIYFERSETPLFLTSEETDAVINALELEILSDISPEQARLLEGVMGKIDGQRLTPVCAVACHGVDDYSLSGRRTCRLRWYRRSPETAVRYTAGRRISWRRWRRIPCASFSPIRKKEKSASAPSRKGSIIWMPIPIGAALNEAVRKISCPNCKRRWGWSSQKVWSSRWEGCKYDEGRTGGIFVWALQLCVRHFDGSRL